MKHPSKRTEAAAATNEELVQDILDVLQRSFTTVGPTGPTRDLAEFFRTLDGPTLRAIAYQHGVFERADEVEPEPDERE
jgi:hypothetical protein